MLIRLCHNPESPDPQFEENLSMSSALTTDTPTKQKLVKRINPSSNTNNTHSSINKSAANHQTPYTQKSTDTYIDQEQISPL
jgi:hypothetical protein